MSPRRRLRVRYERTAETEAAGAPGPPTVASPAEEPASTGGDGRAATELDGRGRAAASAAPGGTPDAREAAAASAAPGGTPDAREAAAAPDAEGPAPAAEPAVQPVAGPTAPGTAPLAPPRRRLRAMLGLAGLAVLAFITGVLVFNNLVMPRLIHGVGQVTVPDLTNLTIGQAEQALRPLGLQISRAGERFDPAVPRGFVVSQDPAAGTAVRGGRRVSVVVSLGEEFSSVPALFGESVRAARLLIERAGLRVGRIVTAPSEEVGEGLVTGSDPSAETVLPRDTPVHLLVSTGPGEESFVMSDLLGREVAGVRRQLEALGFPVELRSGGAARGTIIAQEPAPGSRITRGTPIRLQAAGRMIR